MNWADPEARLALIERVGAEEYNRLFKQHQQASTVDTVNGYHISTINTAYGLLYHVRAGGMAYSTLAEARDYAKALAPGDASTGSADA